MNNAVLLQSVRFIVLVLLQVTLLNTINLSQYINPYLYILFIITFPISDKDNRLLFIFLSFLLGLSVDLFSDSGGAHAAASVLIGYLRKPYMRFSFGVSYQQQGQKIAQSPFSQRLIYISLMILTHHLTLFFIESFSFANMMYVIQKTLLSSILTLVLILFSISMFKKKQ
ncbi:rod shape-determining protein MreD [Neptunitalea lumnitzerae]|uniref:Rod shape-determining protein MreD n=1 Tax=Neptunitalea lumnitzerae TaxID=2965509 RepID=A0ABQ5MH07_9FLAO|nr:rod shape-determining protein MreD [Neptunitalea sp. Y10]GLB48705.1 rod shape-determining protein MreD [Neptunitalea sp. Y10]